MMYCGGIPDKPAVMQSNYTVIVMGLKPGSLLCQNTDPSSVCVCMCVYGCGGGGLLISRSDPGSDWTFNYPSLHTHRGRRAVIEKQLVYLGE